MQKIRDQIHVISVVAAVIMLVIWVAVTISFPANWATNIVPIGLFSLLVFSTMVLGIPFGRVWISLQPMMSIASYLVLGVAPAGWILFISAFFYEAARYYFHEQLRLPQTRMSLLEHVGRASANATFLSGSLLAGGLVYEKMGGVIPAANFSRETLVPFVVLVVVYLLTNYILAGFYIVLSGRSSLRRYVSSLPLLSISEIVMISFAPLTAMVYLQLDSYFLFFTVLNVVAAYIMYDLAASRRHLERRVQELNTLQAVGQALSSNLDLDGTLRQIYEEVKKLLPAPVFYISLYDEEADMLAFPLVMENDKRVYWPSREFADGNGLTEHIFKVREPKLINGDVAEVSKALGIDTLGQKAKSWLGVPIQSGTRMLGVLAVQSFSEIGIYDQSHQEVLVTIAAQAAIAIQNARLYSRTDDMLARRIRELDSILKTTSEGILLLDIDWYILAANKAMATFLGIAQTDIIGELQEMQPMGDKPLIELVGYTEKEMQADCERLTSPDSFETKVIMVPGPPKRYVKRTLTPVFHELGVIVGWLLLFRDVTEEKELERLREDLTGMLVHDLRSPLGVLIGSVSMIELSIDAQLREELDELFQLVDNSSKRMMSLINTLLDIGKLESDEMDLDLSRIEVKTLLDSVVMGLSPTWREAAIKVPVVVEEQVGDVTIDLEHMHRVLHNLVDNAIKFTPDGGTIEVSGRKQENGRLLIAVKDSGTGIPPEAMSRLFKKFQQVINRNSRRKGTGLGLTYCKLAVEAHGGRIWAESTGVPGEGTTFFIELDFANEESVTAE